MAAKGSRVRFELGRLEVAGVVVSTAAGLFVVFLLGIYAGRGMAERRLELDAELVRLPVAEEVAQDDDELTFYATLAGQQAAEAVDEPETGDRIEEVVSAATVRDDAAARAEEDLPEAAPAAASPRAPREETRPARKPPVPLREPEARVALAVVDDDEVEEAREDTGPPATGGEWSVQVTATRDPRHAESIKRQLTTAGYRAYIVQARRQGETFHRVRVGHYPSLDAAQQVASLLRRQPGITGAFVASD